MAHEINRYEYITAVSCCRDLMLDKIAFGNDTTRHGMAQTVRGTIDAIAQHKNCEMYFVIFIINTWRCVSKAPTATLTPMALWQRRRPELVQTIEFYW